MLNKLKKLIGSAAPERQQPEETKQVENVKYAEELEASQQPNLKVFILLHQNSYPRSEQGDV